mmetsp:Transcript_34040/g.67637  ORF Transcript_34040/g.67637 Transcript_34040/m.67637 type:complete len:146 (-) Transcript_34040:195-632(-)
MFQCCDAESAAPTVPSETVVAQVPQERAPSPKAAESKAVPVKVDEPPPQNSGDVTFFIKVNPKPGDKVGLDVTGLGPQLKVKTINPGIIKDWNTSNPKQAVRVGDFIVSVNGITGDMSQPQGMHMRLLAALQQKEPLEIKVVRQA